MLGLHALSNQKNLEWYLMNSSQKRLKVLPVIFKNPFTIEWMQWALSLKVYIACVVMIALWMDETEEW